MPFKFWYLLIGIPVGGALIVGPYQLHIHMVQRFQYMVVSSKNELALEK